MNLNIKKFLENMVDKNQIFQLLALIGDSDHNMELRKSIEYINEKLLREYGRELDGRPKFRVVFSDDQYEKRLTTHDDHGNELITPEVRLLPKYKQYIR